MNEALEVFVRKEVEGLDYDLVELRQGGTARTPLLDIRIDRPDGSKISVDDCARVSRAL
jgi:ribosome maturation factor RimP